jgi:hypothetical protein
MLRKTLIVLAVGTLGTALVSADASARAGFRGGGFHRVGVGGWHGGVARAGWRGGGWHGGVARVGWRGGGWGWRAPAVAAAGVGVGLGLASAAAWNANAAAWGPGWNSGWGSGWGNNWDNSWNSGSGGGGCTGWRQVWTGWGWRMVPVNACW